MERHRGTAVLLDECHRDGRAIRPFRIGAGALRSDEAALLVREAQGIDDALGHYDFREDRGAEAASAIGFENAVTKFAALAEVEMKHLESATSWRVPAR